MLSLAYCNHLLRVKVQKMPNFIRIRVEAVFFEHMVSYFIYFLVSWTFYMWFHILYSLSQIYRGKPVNNLLFFVITGSTVAIVIAARSSMMSSRCQFHQHFVNTYFKQKCYVQFFCTKRPLFILHVTFYFQIK